MEDEPEAIALFVRDDRGRREPLAPRHLDSSWSAAPCSGSFATGDEAAVLGEGAHVELVVGVFAAGVRAATSASRGTARRVLLENAT